MAGFDGLDLGDSEAMTARDMGPGTEAGTGNGGGHLRNGGRLDSAQNEGQGCATVGVAVGGGNRAIADLAILADDPLDGVEIFTNFAFLQGGAESGEEFGFKRGGELAEFDFAVFVARGAPFTEFAGEVIAEADACTGVVGTDQATALKARAENFDLFGGGEVLDGENLSGDEGF